MNIFVLDEDPILAAQMHCDQHVGKMIAETAQMLSTPMWYYLATDSEKSYWKSKSKVVRDAARLIYKNRTKLYLPTHVNHPCSKWARESSSNFEWLYKLGIALSEEFFFRRKKQHKSSFVIKEAYKYKHFIRKGKLTPFVLAFEKNYPYLIDYTNPIQSYRNFYIKDKIFARYQWGRKAPTWFIK